MDPGIPGSRTSGSGYLSDYCVKGARNRLKKGVKRVTFRWFHTLFYGSHGQGEAFSTTLLLVLDVIGSENRVSPAGAGSWIRLLTDSSGFQRARDPENELKTTVFSAFEKTLCF